MRRVEKEFVLSARILALGSSYLRLTGIEETLLPDLRAIVSRCGDTAGIAILIDGEILYIAHYSEQRGVRAVASTGVRYPAHATSLGRMLLAGLSRSELDDYFRTVRLGALHRNDRDRSAPAMRCSMAARRRAPE